MKLHYSQTLICVILTADWFQYLMKLHYSQTIVVTSELSQVSVPYEITLLSNPSKKLSGTLTVSVPYEITLLSNQY